MRQLIAAITIAATPATAGDVTIFAAASLQGPLDEIAEVFERETGHDVTLSYAGSSAIARQVEAGAPADIVFLANEAWMDHLVAEGAVQSETVRPLVTNRLVLIGSWQMEGPLPLTALPEELGERRLALALTEAVPAGIYARAALEELDLWGTLAPQVIESDNVRTAQLLVAMGAARFGIVYATDVVHERRVTVLADIPEDTHPPIRYPVALGLNASAEAAEFMAFFDHPIALATFQGAGFGRPE